MNLNVEPQAVIDELSMQVAQLVRDNAVLRAQSASLAKQLQALEDNTEGKVRNE